MFPGSLSDTLFQASLPVKVFPEFPSLMDVPSIPLSDVMLPEFLSLMSHSHHPSDVTFPEFPSLMDVPSIPLSEAMLPASLSLMDVPRIPFSDGYSQHPFL